MTNKKLELAYFKEILQKKRSEIQETIDTGDDAARPVELDQTRVGRLSRMDAMQAQAMSIEAKRRRDIELVRIKSALERIEDDNYGECLECLECLEQIPLARLEHNPAVTLCVQCAEQLE